MTLSLSHDLDTTGLLQAFDLSRAYVIRATDGRWLAKTMTDGEVIVNADCKSRACVDCAHHSFEQEVKKDHYTFLHYCERPALRDLVTGQKTLCHSNRLNNKVCGWEAKYFTPKADKKNA